MVTSILSTGHWSGCAERQPYDRGRAQRTFPAGQSVTVGTDTPVIGRIVQAECSNPSTSCRSIDRAVVQYHWPMTCACYCSSSNPGRTAQVRSEPRSIGDVIPKHRVSVPSRMRTYAMQVTASAVREHFHQESWIYPARKADSTSAMRRQANSLAQKANQPRTGFDQYQVRQCNNQAPGSKRTRSS